VHLLFGGKMVVTKIGSGEARTKWRDLLELVYTGTSDIIIERSGKDVAALISVDDYKAVQEQLAELRSERRAAAAYEEWKQDPSTVRSLKDVKTSLAKKELINA
jgi:prevent-host-death family protein